jgi:hypothetical protein
MEQRFREECKSSAKFLDKEQTWENSFRKLYNSDATKLSQFMPKKMGLTKTNSPVKETNGKK